MADDSLIRLQKFLAHAGVCSRRRAERLIVDGRVEVDGQIVSKLGTKIDPIKSKVKVDGKLVRLRDNFHYYVLNKPPGFLTTLFDPYGRPTIKELISNIPERVYPVGRLDKNSQGLILLTDNGELSYKLLHPKFKVPKTYIVTVIGKPNKESIKRFETGIEIEKDVLARAKEVKLLSYNGRCSTFKIVLTEGRKRQIRHMFNAIGHKVIKLIRVKIGPISLDDLQPGQVRPLNKDEIKLLLMAVSNRT